MSNADQQLPRVDLRGCRTPREVRQKIEAFLDEHYAGVVRAQAARLIREDVDCETIAEHIALLRVAFQLQKTERLHDLAVILEDLANGEPQS